MTERVTIGRLNIAKVLKDLLENEIAPGTGVSPAHFWSEMESVLEEFVPRNRAVLAKRDEFQAKIGRLASGTRGDSRLMRPNTPPFFAKSATFWKKVRTLRSAQKMSTRKLP